MEKTRVHRALVAMRLIDGDGAWGECSPRHLHDVQEQLQCVLHPSLIALFAAGCSELADYGCALDRVVALTRAARAAGCPGSLVAFGQHPSNGVFYCVAAAPEPAEALELHYYEPTSGKLETQPLADWLDALVDGLREYRTKQEMGRPEAEPSADDLRMFADIVAAATSEGPARWVRHPKFGRGKLIAESGTGADRRFDVEFEGGKRRTLLARFLADEAR